MELLPAALAEPFRHLYLFITARVKNQFKIHSNYRDLEKKMGSLWKLKQGVDEDEALRYTPRTEVGDWSQRVGELKNKFDPVQAAVTTNGDFGCIRSLNCKLSSNIVRWLEDAKQLIAEGTSFQNIPAAERVEHIPGPSVVGQATASRNLEEIMKLLRDDKVKMIGVWGMGGVGKTTLVQNLNNRLEQSKENLFSIVIWAVVSSHGTRETIQTRIAERLGMTIRKEESEELVRSGLCRKLKEGRFLLILDDLWNKVDLDKVGIPRLENHIGSKIIITSRSAEVCNSMGTDLNFKVLHQSDEEAWELFAKKVGEEVVNKKEIKPLAEEVVKECNGLPLALTVVGASMRKKRLISQWEYALSYLRRAQPLNREVEKEVFIPLKWSYDCLESTQDEPLKSCFLFMCLFPEDYEVEVESLPRYWLAEGLLDENKNYQEMFNICETIVERLKDCCLLESGIHDQDCVRMHDVVRDVGIWIATSLEDGCKSIISAGASETQIYVAVQKELVNCSSRVKRVSFMESGIKSLPNCEVQCPETSTLFLQRNFGLCEVPYSFLKGFQALRILDLSHSNITSLPLSLAGVCQLRALFLSGCSCLARLPPLAALGTLQVLDCSGSGINKLPQGFEKLTNLRILDLSDTEELRSIPAEKISKLCSLEYLNIMYSGTKCGFGKENEDELHFEELLELNHLMALHIDLKVVANVTIADVSKLQRIKDARVTVHFRGFHFPGDELIGWVLRYSVECKIYDCKGVDVMLCNQVRNIASFAYLKEFYLIKCCISLKTSPLPQCVTKCDLMPNLKILGFTMLSGLESLSDFSNFLGLRFTKLRSIFVNSCDQLEHLLLMGDNGIDLQKLEDIHIQNCKNLIQLFKKASSYNFLVLPELQRIDIIGCKKLIQVFINTSSCRFAPKLKHMALKSLPELVKFFEADDASLCESLEFLEVKDCDKLRKLPLGIQNPHCKCRVCLEGKQEWWDKLEWDSQDSKIHLQSCFTPISKEEER